MKNKPGLSFMLSRFYFKEVWKEVPFIVVVGLGLALMAAYIIIAKGSFEAEVMPSTYEILNIVRRFQPVILALMALYSGELLAKDSIAKINPLLEVLPYSNGFKLTAQIKAMIGVLISVLLLLMASGLITQLVLGFYAFNIGLYLIVLFSEMLFNGIFFIILAFFIHVLLNHKFLGHAIIILLIFGRGYLEIWGLEHRLYHYGKVSLGPYSDLVGFQTDSIKAFTFYSFLWLALALILYQYCKALIIRGIETQWNTRLKMFKQRFKGSILYSIAIGALIFIVSGSVIYINTFILNGFESKKSIERKMVAYETQFKAFENQPTPEVVSVSLDINLFPTDNAYDLEGQYVMINSTDQPIDQLFIQENLTQQILTHSVTFNRDHMLKSVHPEFKLTQYMLSDPMLPGDSILMSFQMTYNTKGFAQNRRQELHQTASFFTNAHLPQLEYNSGFELKGSPIRARYGLMPRRREREINDPEGYEMGLHNAHSVLYEANLSTESGFWASTSGTLLNQWSENGREHFKYSTQEAIENQFVVITGKFDTVSEKYIAGKDTVALNIFHHPSHTYNLKHLMHGLSASMSYYSKHFSPYQYDQLNLLEVPRTHDFAMSIPNTIAFSEAMGFMLQEDQQGLNVPFYIAAHEVAHQWWGDQVRGARVKGEGMLVETLSHYAAGIVTLHEFGESSMEHIVRFERGRYLKGRKRESDIERPLAQSEDQSYIHYGKGLINMMTLRHYISEDSVNSALRRIIEQFPAGKKRYPDTEDLLLELRSVTADSLQYLITDLFEKVIFMESSIQSAIINKTPDDRFEVDVNLITEKFEVNTEGITQPVPTTDWIEIAVYAVDDEGIEQIIYKRMHKFDQPRNTLSFTFSQSPSRIVIDPNSLLMDRNLMNNEYRF